MHIRTRSGQSLMELLVGIAVGAIFVIGAATIVAPSLQINKQAGNVQGEAQFAQELLSNVRAWASGNWGAVLALGTSTANKYYLNTGTSPFTAVSGGGESISTCFGGTLPPGGASRKITIDHTKVPNTDQTNFPVLFSGTYSYLATKANGGGVNNANGYDIFFTSDAAGQNILPFEQESYSSSTGAVNYWIKVPTVSHTTDTVIYLWYGNTSITSSQASSSAVWTNGYSGVWHMANGTTLSTNDSTVNGNTGTPGAGATATAGILDGGASFNGTATGKITFNTSSTAWNFSGDATVSTWVKTSSNGVMLFDIQNNNPLIYLEIGPTTAGGSSNKAVAYFRTNGGGVLVASGGVTVNDNNWHYIQAVRHSGTSVQIYVDGALDTTTGYGDAGAITASPGASIGSAGGSFNLNGIMDDLRISNVARSSDWIATEYNNQKTPGTFYSIGSAITTSTSTVATVQTCANYNRYFYLTDVYRDSSGNATTTSSGNYYDPSTKLVTVMISNTGSSAPPLAYSLYITRSGNNALSQGSWIGGSGQSGPVTFISNTYAAATSVVVNATGSLSLGPGPSPGGSCNSTVSVPSIAFYALNEGSGSTANDASGNGNNATWVGTASGTAGTYYKSGNGQTYAGYFDGSTDYISIPAGGALNNISGDMTMSAWINMSSAKSAVIATLGNDSPCCGWGAILSTSATTVGFSVVVSGAGYGVSASLPPLNTWAYIVGVRSGGSIIVYVNGVATTSTAPLGNLRSYGAGRNSDIGNILPGPSFFPGSIEDVHYYNVALPASDISTLYTLGPGY